jgi:phosphatidylserine/phosphatidylglycerophosphate/cardiolipin synthase-like enzyme
MSASLFDVAYKWFGTGPGVPNFALPFAFAPTRLHRFGDVLSNILQDSLRLSFPLPDQLRAPVNGMLWRVQAQPREDFPVLKLADGARLVPDEHDLLLEVWPSAFRRLEYVFSSLEVPVSLEGSELPQAPAPRWFWIRGIGPGIETPAQTIANAQFAGSSVSIDVVNFLDGRAPLYVAAGDQLTTFDPDDEIEIRAFDGNGLVLDPDYVFMTFQRLAADSDFQRLQVQWQPSIAPWNPLPRRHVLLFSDRKGAPYVSQADPDPLPAGPLPTVPPRTLLAGSERIDIPDHGVVIVDETAPEYAALEGAAFVELALPGEHQRISLLPHGTLGGTTKASFSEYSFFRVEVVDFSRWFPRNPNPRNELLGPDGLRRYTDGNEVIPLVDGRNAFRAWYRAIRATYAVDSYASKDDVPALDPNAAVGEPDPALKELAKILMCHAWLEPACAFLGRRVMLAAPRTQPGVDPEESLPGAAELLGSLKVIGTLPQPGRPDGATGAHGRLWWLLYTPPPGGPELPPGAFVEIRQLDFLTDFRGDDPRLPGEELTADLYGVIAPLDASAPTSWGFVSTEGRVVIPALFGTDTTPTAVLRVVVWTGTGEEPDRIDWKGVVKGQRRARAYGEVTLPLPETATPLEPPLFSRAGVVPSNGIRLDFEGVTGRAVVVLEPNVLEVRLPVVVLNARTGESYGGIFNANPGGPIRIAVEPFALRDKILVGFPAGTEPVPAECDVFFVLEVTDAMIFAGEALAHPTELLGALRDAISAGIDTRVIGWQSLEGAPENLPYVTPGLLAATGAAVNGKSGQTILDHTGRRESSVHHQKGSFVRTALPLRDGDGKLRDQGGVLALVGGIDPRASRYDSDPHPQLDPDRPSRSTWHDIQCRVRGRAAWDVYRNYRHRWNTSVANPELATHFGGPDPLPPVNDPIHGADVEDDPDVTLQDGPHTVQINRTIAPHLPEYAPFVEPETGDLSVLKAYERIIDEARQFLYIEDQYFWDRHLATKIHEALFEKRIEFVMLLLPKHLGEKQLLDLVLYAQRRRCLNILLHGESGTEDVSDRVIVFTIASEQRVPIYVHAKSMVADDLWMNISSSNFSRRSQTYDSEIGAATIDSRMRRGGGLTPRQFRVELMADHLRLLPEERSLVEDPRDAFRLFKALLAGQIPGRKFGIEAAGIAEMDVFHTHLGTLPADLDGTFVDALNFAFDPDGRMPASSLVPLRNVLDALAAGTDTVTFGGLGTLRLIFDVSAIGPAADIQVRVTMIVPEDPEVEGDGPQTLTLGPFPANAPARVGLVKVGVRYTVRATPEATAAPGVPLAPTIEHNSVTPTTFTFEDLFVW